MRTLLITFSLYLTTLFLVSSCASRSSVSHPGYSTIPKDATVGIVPLKYNLIIQDYKIIARELSIPEKSLHDSLAPIINSTIDKSTQAALSHTIITLPDSTVQRLGRPESMKIHDNTYVKVAWPAQGTALTIDATQSPDLIFFIYECTLGYDLSGEELFDYTRSNREGSSNADHLSIVMSWSLWDNQRQQYISYGYADAQAPSQNPVTKRAINQLIYTALTSAFSQTPLTTGVGNE
ncbi:MAG: hypothetical protein OCD01_14780 [Fibrobacterales bacterium]